MRILYVINHAGYFLTHRLPLALAARAAGHDVHVATPRSRHVPAIESAGLAWHEIPLRRSGTNPWREIATFLSLVGLYRRLRPELVHQVTSKPVLYGTLAARLTRVPRVVNALAGLGHLHISRRRSLRLLKRLVGLGYRLSLRHPNMRVIFQNADDRDLFVDRGWLQRSATVIIPGSGVDMQVFVPRERRPDGPLVVLFPSRMLRTKGLVEVIEASRILKGRGRELRVLLVGDPDPDNPASVDEETILGWVGEGVAEYFGRRDDMPAWFRQADIVCLPSYREGLPKSLIEAAACAVPSVTTDVPGCRDVVIDGETGLLVPVAVAEPIADAIEKLAADPERRAAMGKTARARAESIFALDLILDQTLAIYEEMAR